jgi:hypothetical protein
MTRYMCNPMPLPYRYQAKKTGKQGAKMFREAADPTLIRFKDHFLLFVSVSGGFWYSKNLVDWDFKETPELPNYDYAPDVHEVNGRVIFSASRGDRPCMFYASADPITIPFEEVHAPFVFWDPALFQDEDGRLYFYWGCGNKDPLWGLEMNPDTFEPISEKIPVMEARHNAHGWERIGENNTDPHSHPYIEGAFLNKVNGKYYLQYSAPGTEFNVYSNGVYVADKPLGPFVYQAHNPFSSRPGGFVTAAGHGSTVQDFDGNWWHIASMRISINDIFERRLGLFPCEFDTDGIKWCNQHFTDYPFTMPDGKRTDMNRTAPEWNLLSYNKQAAASSHQPNHEPAKGTNEDICNWWAAEETDPAPWYQLDLLEVCRVHAIQINFADHQVKLPDGWEGHPHARAHGRIIYGDRGGVGFLLECSEDGDQWTVIKDTRNTPEDNSNDLIILQNEENYRYVRMSHITRQAEGVAALSGLRVFGFGNGVPPAQVKTLAFVRSTCGMEAALTWQTANTDNANVTGYNLRYGISPEKLYNSWQVVGDKDVNELRFTFLHKSEDCYMAVDSYNENGVTPGEIIKIGK